jgi:hypothetical protein
MIKNFALTVLLCVAAPIGALYLAAQNGAAHADTPDLVHRDVKPDNMSGRILLAQAGSGAVSSGGDGSAAPAPTATEAPVSIGDDYAKLKAAYDALKNGPKDGSPRTLLWAGLLAVAMKVLIDLLKLLSDRFDRGKKYIPWVAMISAVPIALLSHYAAGEGWMASVLIAGGGPGAVIVHELLGLFATKKAVDRERIPSWALPFATHRHRTALRADARSSRPMLATCRSRPRHTSTFEIADGRAIAGNRSRCTWTIVDVVAELLKAG